VASVSVVLPSMLADIVGCARVSVLEARTLGEVLERLIELHPALGVHLLAESGELRQHVLCIHNGASSRWSRDSFESRVADGDTVQILQAVSGG
jgi:molybdopterin converting factor small subunit